MPSFLSIHITVPLRAEAETIARALVERKLAACVNIVPGVKSIYRWKGSVEEADEVLLIAKTRAELFRDFENCVKSLHSHECPCIVTMPITGGHQPYLDWLAQETEA